MLATEALGIVGTTFAATTAPVAFPVILVVGAVAAAIIASVIRRPPQNPNLDYEAGAEFSIFNILRFRVWYKAKRSR